MTQKWLLVTLRLAPFGVILYEVLVSKLPASFILPVLWIEELLSLPMILLIALGTLFLARQGKLAGTEEAKLRRVIRGFSGTFVLYFIFFIVHTLFMIAGNWRISVLEAGGEKALEPIMLTLMTLTMPEDLFPGINSINPEAVSFIKRSFLIMIGFHFLELYFNLRKIKSEEDYHVAMAWQGQPLVLNHLIIVLGGFLLFAQEILSFSPYYIFLFLYAVRFFNIMGFFQLKPTTKYDIQKALTEFTPLTIFELNQRQPFYSKDFPLEISNDRFWEKVNAAIGQPGEAVLLYYGADNQSQEIKEGTLLEINKSVGWEKFINKQEVNEIGNVQSTSILKGHGDYLRILKREPNSHCLVVMGTQKQAIYIDIYGHNKDEGFSSIQIKIYLALGKRTEALLSFVKPQLEKLFELRITALLSYLTSR